MLDRGDSIAPRFAALGIEYVAVLGYRDLGIEPIVPDASSPGASSPGIGTPGDDT
jgi:hypothetical protein